MEKNVKRNASCSRSRVLAETFVPAKHRELAGEHVSPLSGA